MVLAHPRLQRYSHGRCLRFKDIYYIFLLVISLFIRLPVLVSSDIYISSILQTCLDGLLPAPLNSWLAPSLETSGSLHTVASNLPQRFEALHMKASLRFSSLLRPVSSFTPKVSAESHCHAPAHHATIRPNGLPVHALSLIAFAFACGASADPIG